MSSLAICSGMPVRDACLDIKRSCPVCILCVVLLGRVQALYEEINAYTEHVAELMKEEKVLLCGPCWTRLVHLNDVVAFVQECALQSPLKPFTALLAEDEASISERDFSREPLIMLRPPIAVVVPSGTIALLPTRSPRTLLPGAADLPYSCWRGNPAVWFLVSPAKCSSYRVNPTQILEGMTRPC